MIGFPTTPSVPPASSGESPAPPTDGAFAEMLGRGLGSQLIGRFAAGLDSTDGAAVPAPSVEATDHAETSADRAGEAALVAGAALMGLLHQAGRTDRTEAPAQRAVAAGGHVGLGGLGSAGIGARTITTGAGMPAPVPDTDPATGRGGTPTQLLPTSAPSLRTVDPTMPAATPVPTPIPTGLGTGGASASTLAPVRPSEVDGTNPMSRPVIIDDLRPVRHRTTAPVITTDGPDPATDVHPLGSGVSAPGDAGVESTTAATTGAPTARFDTMVDRVVKLVQMQSQLPPPRSISVDLPEMEGLRLVVSMRSDGSVHLAPAGSNSQQASVSNLLTAVKDALSEQGFDLASDGQGRHQERRSQDPQSDLPPRPFRPRRIWARQSGAELRI